MRRKPLIAAVIILLVLFRLAQVRGIIFKGDKYVLSEHIYQYMKEDKNQKKVFQNAIILNDNKSSNACVYFVAEVLRKNKVSVSKDISNTAQLLSVLEEKGWEKITDYRSLKRGDIAFTTDESGNRDGVPSHTYVFMGWVEEGSYDYAYICDNQAKDYENKIYHVRNIKDRDTVNGITKDAFSFYMSPR